MNKFLNFEDNIFYVDKAEKNTDKWPIRKAAKEFFTKLGYIVKEVRLPVGDFKYKNVIFERKTIGDFVKSIQKKHLFNQAVRMRKNFPYCFVLIEGSKYDFIYDENNYGKRKFSEKQFNGSIASLEMDYDVRVPPEFETYYDLFDFIHRICKRLDPNKKIDINHLFTKERDIYAEDVLMCTEGVSQIKAKKLLTKYTIDEIRYKSIEELSKLDGFGPKTIKKIQNDLNKMGTHKFDENML